MAIVVILALLMLLWPFIARKSTEVVVTDRRLIAKFGLVSIHSIEIRLSKIESVRVTQGLIGKLFRYGDIVVTGTGSTFDPIRNISHPLPLRNALNEAMELYSPVTPPEGRPPAEPPALRTEKG
ncbi:MAG TPA: PH domain-containing protein [Steroidobacteraceae bacterium]